MSDCDVAAIEPVQLLANRLSSRREDLSVNIPKGLDPVWAFIRSEGLKFGLNVAVYLEGPKRMEVGVQVPGDFEPPADLVRTQSPGGFAAHTSHIGPYSELDKAYDRLHTWIAQKNLKMLGPFWEVYGHWNEDQSKLRTDIYFLVEETK